MDSLLEPIEGTPRRSAWEVMVGGFHRWNLRRCLSKIECMDAELPDNESHEDGDEHVDEYKRKVTVSKNSQGVTHIEMEMDDWAKLTNVKTVIEITRQETPALTLGSVVATERTIDGVNEVSLKSFTWSAIEVADTTPPVNTMTVSEVVRCMNVVSEQLREQTR